MSWSIKTWVGTIRLRRGDRPLALDEFFHVVAPTRGVSVTRSSSGSTGMVQGSIERCGIHHGSDERHAALCPEYPATSPLRQALPLRQAQRPEFRRLSLSKPASAPHCAFLQCRCRSPGPYRHLRRWRRLPAVRTFSHFLNNFRQCLVKEVSQIFVAGQLLLILQ
jgi:hypothetical protein